MYERSYGPKYDELGGYQPASEIAKRMRADIKELVKKGELPADLKYSVRIDNYSMGRSINITASYDPRLWTVEPDHFGHERPVLTEEGAKIKKVLGGVHWAYNHDGSDIQTDYFDVNYYGHADVQDKWNFDHEVKEKAAKAAKKAHAAANPPEPYEWPADVKWPTCDHEVGYYKRRDCTEPATVIQKSKSRYVLDHPRCDQHKRGSVRPLVRAGEVNP